MELTAPCPLTITRVELAATQYYGISNDFDIKQSCDMYNNMAYVSVNSKLPRPQHYVFLTWSILAIVTPAMELTMIFGNIK